jgi:hypothetical protein
MLKNLKDAFQVSKILSTYTWSNVVTFPAGDRIQVNLTTFLKCLALPENPIANVLILQGGVKHMNSNSYYIRVACSFLPKSFRIFIFEKILPVCNPEFGHDVADCLSLIKREFSGPTCVIGFSMGSVLLYTYLSFGYDQADLYVPVCGPLDLDRFLNVISNHYLFKMLNNRTCRSYQVKDYEDLLEIAGTSVEENKEFERLFIYNLNRNADKWSSKTIYIISSEDPLTSLNDLDLLEQRPLTYYIKGGWHCCSESILLSVTLASEFLKNVNIKIEDLNANYGVLDVIKNVVFY